jgi:carboxylesterase type B
LGFAIVGGRLFSQASVADWVLRISEIFALEWVQKHVAAFGGDPERVVL